MQRIVSGVALGAAGFVAFVAAPAQAEVVHYAATLTSGAETPPNDSKGSGKLTASFDTSTKKLDWTIEYSGLTGPALAAHFHGPAPAGKPASVEVPLTGSLASPIHGSAMLTDAQAKDLADGMLYINIHTAANKGGEIRGQMEKGM